MKQALPWLGGGILAVALLWLLFSDSGPPTVPTPPPLPATHPDAGTIRGRVKFTGTPPPNPRSPQAGNPECARLHAGPAIEEIVLVKDGLIENAFVHIMEGVKEKYPWPADEVSMANEKCLYKPRVVGAQANQWVRFSNADPADHNVRSMDKQGGVNRTLPPGGDMRVRYRSPEVMIPVRCDIHPWMLGWVGVVGHPFFKVTGADGAFEFPKLPPGDYVLEAWHEKFGVKTLKATIPPKGSVDAEFEFRP